MAHVGETLGLVPTATEGEELDERMCTYYLLFCSSDPTEETLRIAMKLFPGEVRCSGSKGLPGCVGTSVPCHTAVIKCMARAAEGRKGLAGLRIRGTAIAEGRQWLRYVVRPSLQGDSGRSGRQLVTWHLQ